MTRWMLVAALGLTACSDEYGPRYLADVQPGECCAVIAHAGGAIYGNAYTNSKEALEASIAMGTRLIELDYSKSSDGQWFVTHDWKVWADATSYPAGAPLPPAALDVTGRPFKVIAGSHGVNNAYTVMRLEDADAIIKAHPDVRIVTDAKDSNAELIEAITRLGGLEQYVIQAYSVGEVQEIFAKHPNANVILSIYRLEDSWDEKGFSDALLSQLSQERRLMGITIPMSAAYRRDNLTRLRRATSTPILIHGAVGEINSRLIHWDLGRKGVSGFYLD